MGLDVTAYRQLVIENPLASETEEDDSDLVRFYVNKDFAGRSDDLVADAPYSFEDAFDFRAGSYGGYSAWRDELARLAGYTGAEATWGGKITEGPFFELICFSDCEGAIGPVTSKKLAQDFADHQAKAEAITDHPAFLERYNNWRKAFEMASDSGAVRLW